MVMDIFFFFFKAKEDMRVGVASRGRGDVKKRQELSEPYRQYQCHQYKVALLEALASPVQRSVETFLGVR